MKTDAASELKMGKIEYGSTLMECDTTKQQQWVPFIMVHAKFGSIRFNADCYLKTEKDADDLAKFLFEAFSDLNSGKIEKGEFTTPPRTRLKNDVEH